MTNEEREFVLTLGDLQRLVALVLDRVQPIAGKSGVWRFTNAEFMAFIDLLVGGRR